MQERERLTENLLTGLQRYEFLDSEAPAGLVHYWLAEIERSGETVWYGPVAMEPAALNNVRLSLAQNHPNPFQNGTRITFTLSEPGPVTLQIFDLSGREVARPLQDTLATGLRSVDWDGRDTAGRPVASGIYFYRLKTVSGIRVQRMIKVP